jgi:hypothetical protein
MSAQRPRPAQPRRLPTRHRSSVDHPSTHVGSTHFSALDRTYYAKSRVGCTGHG